MQRNRIAFLLVFGYLVVGGDFKYEYEVPEPRIEVFAPKGLRISIEDSRNIEKVEFIVSVPGVSEQLVHRTHKTDVGRWTYWNPDVVVHLCEKIYYKIIVKHLDMYCTREGVHVVQKRIGANETVCSEDYSNLQKIQTSFPNWYNFDRRMESSASEKSHFQSAHSTYKDLSARPITKSSTMTASGTFYLKPTGEVEASGYKSGSSFDSTKSEGEQWKHFRSNLTPEELEEMRRTQLKGLDLAGKFFPGSGMGFDEEFHQSHRTSAYSHTQPTLRFQFEDRATSDTSSSRSSHVAPSETMYKTIEYVREEHSPPGVVRGSSSRTAQSSYSSRNYEDQPNTMAMQASESQVYRTRADLHNFRGGTTTDNRQAHVVRVYNGTIFTPVKSSEPKYPGECIMIPGSDYRSSDNLRHVEKVLYEHRCLAYLNEKATKTEMAELKHQNDELMRKLELLERRILRWETSCKCV